MISGKKKGSRMLPFSPVALLSLNPCRISRCGIDHSTHRIETLRVQSVIVLRLVFMTGG